MSEPGNPATKPYPPASAGWFLVTMLTIAYVFSFVDRYILGLLIEPVKADLGLTDEQIGWIIGPAFSVFYATMGLPLGWLVDRWRRTWIVGIGFAFWSAATAVSGLAQNFWQMFVARMSVGAGEATLSPSAFSMIADSFPPERRGKPIAVYTAALTVGAGLASLIGGAVLVWAKTNEGIELPIIGLAAPWQLAFFAVGLPGILLALFFFYIREPERRLAVGTDASLRGNSMRDALGYVWRHAGTYAGFVSLICVMTIIAYSQSYMPSTFVRTFGWQAENYAFVNAVALLIIGPINVIAMGFISDRWSQSGVKDAPFRLLVIGFLIMVPTAIIPMFMPNGVAAFAVLCVNTIGIGMVSAVGVTALLMITPAPIRGQVVAIYYIAISMAGLWLGPTTVGTLATRVFGEENLNLAMASVPFVWGIVPLLLIPVTRRLYLAQM
ncbi:MAG: MFS transporter, partial [Pseudomonadota bacterium]